MLDLNELTTGARRFLPQFILPMTVISLDV